MIRLQVRHVLLVLLAVALGAALPGWAAPSGGTLRIGIDVDAGMIEASRDLGASAFETFRYIVLPNLASALLTSGMLAFALSFDEIIVRTFTAGQ